jgi:predicted transcriptional regulator
MLRRQADLTLAQVARAAGTSETNVSAYERGVKRTSARTARRLRAVIDAGAASRIHTARLSTAPATAATLRRGLRGGWSTAAALPEHPLR